MLIIFVRKRGIMLVDSNNTVVTDGYFMQADIGTALTPFHYKPANRYSQYYQTESTRKHFEFVV